MTYICANCQKEKNIVFPPETEVSHGICNRHFRLTLLQAGIPESAIEARLKKFENKCKDLFDTSAN